MFRVKKGYDVVKKHFIKKEDDNIPLCIYSNGQCLAQ